MHISSDSYRKLVTWTGEINEKTGDPKNFPTKISFARAYIKNSFDFVVKNFSYDYGIKQYLSQFSGAVKMQKYIERTTMERLLQEKVGVCVQFASLLCILTANEKSTLQKTDMSVSPSVLFCDVKLKNGNFDKHCLNTYNFYGRQYFCDPTMQKSFKNHDFFLKTRQELQNEYYSAERSQIHGAATNIEIKAQNLDKIWDMLSEFKLVTNKTTKDYRTTTLAF